MLVTAGVMKVLVGDTFECEGDPILVRGDNSAAISWVDKEPRAGMIMRLLESKIRIGWGLVSYS